MEGRLGEETPIVESEDVGPSGVGLENRHWHTTMDAMQHTLCQYGGIPMERDDQAGARFGHRP